MVYALEHLGRQLADLPAHSRDHRGPPFPPPTDDSPASAEREQLTALQRPRWNDLTTTLHLRLSVAEETLASAGKMIADPDAIYSAYPLVRTASELSARVSWLLAPTLTAIQRAQRMVGDQLDSLGEMRRLKMPGAKEFATGRIRDVQRRAAAAGLTAEKPPSRTEAVSRAWADVEGDLSPLGAMTYQLLAAVTHGTLYGLMRHVRPLRDGADGALVPDDVDGQYMANLGTDASTDAMAVLMALLPYNRAAQRWMRWTGHTVQDWTSYVAYVASGFRNHLHRAPDGFVAEDDRPGEPRT